MFIPEEILTCVVFLGYRLADKSYRMAGSAFWVVRRKAPDIQENFAYLITAKHVIEHIRDKLGLGMVQIRVNRRDGTLRWVETKLSDWELHGASDVAALRIDIPGEFEHSGWPIDGLATQAFIESERIGIGHDVFMAGMFSRRLGDQKNIPIVRMGNIASIPSRSEPVQTKMGPLTAYLVEARSIGGLSGSPVFVDQFGSLPRFKGRNPSFYLVGLVHGHYDVKDFQNDIVDDGLQTTNVNVGIAIIIPSEEILEVINKFAARDEAEVKARRSHGHSFS